MLAPERPAFGRRFLYRFIPQFARNADDRGVKHRAGTLDRCSMSPPAPRHPYRVTRRLDGPPLSGPQRQTLAALVHLCPAPGADATAAAVARSGGMRHGPVVVILRSLATKGLCTCFEETEQPMWAPTMTGRARVRHAAAFGGSAGRRFLPDGSPPTRPGAARETATRSAS